MGQVWRHFLSLQRGSWGSSTSAAVAPGESAPLTTLVEGAAGRLAPLEEEATSTLAAAIPCDSSLPTESVGGATGRSALAAGVGTSSTLMSAALDDRNSSAVSAEGTAGLSPPEHVLGVSTAGGDESGVGGSS